MSEPVHLGCKVNCSDLTFKRPAKLNARNYETFNRFDARLDAFEEGSMFWSIALTVAEGRSFLAGADIHELSESMKESAFTAHL